MTGHGLAGFYFGTFPEAAASALALHPAGGSRRIIRHRVVNLLRAGATEDAATLLHSQTALLWNKTRDASATLRDLALLDGKLAGLSGAIHLRWRAEALRHAGRLEDSRREAEEAFFRSLDERTGEVP